MNSQKHRTIIYFVSLTIVATIAIQVYWNYLNYQTNKTELINQVQLSLDDAIETYYANIARKHVVTVITTDSIPTKPIDGVHKILRHISNDSLINFDTDTIFKFDSNSDIIRKNESFSFSYTSTDTSFNLSSDSIEVNMLASKLFVSMNEDMIGSPKLAKLIETDFSNKNWSIKFGLLTRNKNCITAPFLCDTIQTFGPINKGNQLKASSLSPFLPPNTQLEIHFSNITNILLKKSLIGMLLSLLLSGAIIFCLLYLFKIIQQQKQLAEIKDDLISNITHEFKTPITTVSAALEGIENFSNLNDIEKTKKYISISNQQLGKLNTMVEKLLETASLDSENLSLKFDKVNVISLINHQLDKFRLNSSNKTLAFHHAQDELYCNMDSFHFESVIGNLLDNAIKYGGNSIIITLKVQKQHTIEIEVEDNGVGIPNDQQSKIFDKFYRIPTGNIHNVKGFGIGLYYAKNIVEKHGGELILVPHLDKTIFKITLNNGH